jgi:hypothetical protein
LQNAALAAPLLGALLFGASQSAALGWPPWAQVPRELAQQPLLERLAARGSARAALPEHQPARLWRQEAWPPEPDSE